MAAGNLLEVGHDKPHVTDFRFGLEKRGIADGFEGFGRKRIELTRIVAKNIENGDRTPVFAAGAPQASALEGDIRNEIRQPDAPQSGNIGWLTPNEIGRAGRTSRRTKFDVDGPGAAEVVKTGLENDSRGSRRDG